MIFLTTTSDETDPELKNRCVTLGVCEHAGHTEAIHRQQRTRRTLSGRQLQHERRAIRSRHQNAQRLLRPLEVVNNYAEQLTFRSDKTKSRRAHDHYLTLIESVTLLHQYQRREGTMTNEAGESVRFVETTLDDIEGRKRQKSPPTNRRKSRKTGAIRQVVGKTMKTDKRTLREVSVVVLVVTHRTRRRLLVRTLPRRA